MLKRAPALLRLLGLVTVVTCSGGSGDQSPVVVTAPHTDSVAITPKPPAPVLVLSADSLSVAAMSGADPVTRTVQVTPGNSAAVTDVTAGSPTYAGAGGWLTVAASTATAPSTLTFTVDPRALSAGSYAATVNVSAANVTPVVVRVAVVVRARPMLTVDPSTLTLDATTADSVIAGNVALKSSSDTIGGLSIASNACAGALANRISSSLSGASTSATVATKITVAGVEVGDYACTVKVLTTQALVDSATRIIPVSVHVHGVPVLSVFPERVAATVAAGPASTTLTVYVSNAGTADVTGLAAGPAAYAGAASGWITGISLSGATAPATLAITVNPAQLATGVYNATVPVTASNAATVSVSVALTVGGGGPNPPNPPAPGGPLSLIIQPSSVSMSGCHVGGFVIFPVMNVRMSDGSSATVGAGTGALSWTSPNVAAFSFGGVLSTSQIPGTLPVDAGCNAPGTSTLVFKIVTTGGQSATWTATVTVVP